MLAGDKSAEGIRGNAVSLGRIFAPFHQRRIETAGEINEQFNVKAAQGSMMRRPGTAEEVAAVFQLLAFDYPS